MRKYVRQPAVAVLAVLTIAAALTATFNVNKINQTAQDYRFELLTERLARNVEERMSLYQYGLT